jgi:O-antigen ligase
LRGLTYYNLAMLISDFEKKLAWLLAVGGGVTAVMVLAWNTNEPVNAPKLLILGFTGFAALSYMIFNQKLLSRSISDKVTFFALTFFVIFSLISIMNSQSSFVTGFFGVWGRNTGFVTYACLAIILAAATQIYAASAVERVLDGLFYAGVFNVIYFVFTLFGIELIPWNNVYQRVLGTFGNPNFVGAFMGLFVILCFVRVIDKSRSNWFRIACLVLIPLTLFEIKKSLASQGVVITGLGLALLGFFYLLWNVKSRVPLIVYTAISTVLGMLAVAGALQRGPLASLIYKSSVSFRGEYWAAGINMGSSNPFFGVGLDSYVIWYRPLRNASALISPGKDVTTNTAHNVYIDIFASGGYPLLLAYVTLTVLALIKIFHGIKTIKKYNSTFVAITILWACYQVQSIVSINQIGIAIWGWILTGLVIGYKVESDPISNSAGNTKQTEKSKGRIVPKEKKKTSIIPILIGGIIGTAVVSPPYTSDVNWRSVLAQPNATNLETGAKSWPEVPERIVQASDIYSKNNVIDKGLELAKYATEKFPHDFRVWYFYYMNANISAEEKARVKKKLHELDPLNSDYK